MKAYRTSLCVCLIACMLNFFSISLYAEELIVCGQNVQNFFYSLDRSRTMNNGIPISNYNDVEGRTAKLNAITNALSPYKADIYAFNEVECCAEVLEILAQSMSTKTGKNYQPVTDGLSYDLNDPDNATGAIKSGFIYNTATIELVGDNVSTAVGYTYVYPNQMRMQTFKSKASGESFTLSMNHFKASTSNNIEDDINKRIANATALLSGLTGAKDNDILIMGDLNAEMDEESMQMLLRAGYEEQLLKYDIGAVYSHCWEPENELIDHVLANETMAQQVTSAKCLHIANPCSTGSKYYSYSDHDPYIVTLELKHIDVPTYSFVKATSVKDGGQYLIAAPINNELHIAKPVPSNKDYSYLYTQQVTEDDEVITLEDMTNAFTFEEAGDGKFYIKDSNGRYAYQTLKSGNTYYTTVAATTNKSTAHKYTATYQTNGTFKILSQTGYYMYGTLYNNSTPEFGMTNYSTLYSGSYLPWLYEYTTTPDGLNAIEYTQPIIPQKVLENGRIIIRLPNGKRYTIQGLELK